MRRKLFASIVIIGLMVMAVALFANTDQSPQVALSQDDMGSLDFVGADACADCHDAEYQQHQRHGHNFKLNSVDGAPPDYPYSEVLETPEGYTWDDVAFVIGGYAWKARFIGHDGFIITGDEDSTTQYNFPLIDQRTGDVIVEAGWVPYNAGKEKAYTCGTCHTTGYNHDTSTNMYDMPGLVGQWEEEGIQCEECHGPGSLHIEAPIRFEMKIETSAEACGACHYRGVEGVVEASGPFIKHHEQYEEIATAPHAAMECIDCHNPHQSAVYADPEVNPNRSFRTTCTDCHFEQTVGRQHDDEGVTCVDCHMPPMTASGARNADLLWADISTHLYQINVDPEAPQFYEDGSARPYITVEYACFRCHTDWDVEEMADAAEAFHD